MYINGGTLNLNVTASDGTGLKCDSIIRMTDGEINIKVAGPLSEGIRANYAAYFDGGYINAEVTADGTKGIRAKKCTKTTDMVLNGGYLYFNGTTVDMTVSGKTYVSDGTACAGIRSDRDFTQTAGDITITMNSSDASALVVKGTENRTGGTLTVK